MDNVWITSDTHFCHSKPFLYEPRGFSSVEEMNEEIDIKGKTNGKENHGTTRQDRCLLPDIRTQTVHQGRGFVLFDVQRAGRFQRNPQGIQGTAANPQQTLHSEHHHYQGMLI